MPDCWENWSTIWLASSVFIFGSLVEFVGCDTVVVDWFIFYSIEFTRDIHLKIIFTETWASVALANIIWSAMIRILKKKIDVKMRLIHTSNRYPAWVGAQVNVRWKQRIGLFAIWSTEIVSWKIRIYELDCNSPSL